MDKRQANRKNALYVLGLAAAVLPIAWLLSFLMSAALAWALGYFLYRLLFRFVPPRWDEKPLLEDMAITALFALVIYAVVLWI